MNVKITKTKVEDAAPGTFLWDTEVKGFGVKITPGGKRIYILQFRMGGRGSPTRRINIGEHNADDLTADKARGEAIKMRGDIRKGLDPAAVRRKGREAPTLRAFSDRYIEDHARPRKKGRTVEEDERNLRLHIVPALGTRKISEVTEAEIARFMAEGKKRPTNANRCLALLSHMMAMAERWGYRPKGSNPCRNVERYEEKKRERFLVADELAGLGDALDAAEKGESEPASALAAIRLLCLTGCRLSEILTLDWQYVDWESARLNLPDSKSGKKSVPLGAAAMTLLEARARKEFDLGEGDEKVELADFRFTGWVCPADRGDGHFVGIQRVWQRIRKAAGLEGVRLHDLRHSFASMAVAGGDSLYMIGKVLGHQQAATTERYSHLSDDLPRQVADRAANRIDAALKLPLDQRKVVRLRKGKQR